MLADWTYQLSYLKIALVQKKKGQLRYAKNSVYNACSTLLCAVWLYAMLLFCTLVLLFIFCRIIARFISLTMRHE